MKREEYKDQCTSKLRYFFLDGELDEKQFTLYESGVLETDTATIWCDIIGESNITRIKLPNNKKFTESVICTDDVTLGECEIIQAGNFSTSGKLFAVQKNNFFLYKFFGKIYDWNSGQKLLEIMERLATFKREAILGLSKEFEAGQDGIIPKTIVFIKVSKKSKVITICTIHAYPNKKQIAFSISKFTLLG